MSDLSQAAQPCGQCGGPLAAGAMQGYCLRCMLKSLTDEPYFSMDFVDDESLATLVREGPLPPRRAAEYLFRIAEAIQHAHDHGVIDRDLIFSDHRSAAVLRGHPDGEVEIGDSGKPDHTHSVES